MAGRHTLELGPLHGYLRQAVRYGATASRLAQYTPELVDLLFSPIDYPHLSLLERAQLTEDLIRDAIRQIGGRLGAAFAILLCIDHGNLADKLAKRRQDAMDVLQRHVDIESFRKPPYEGKLILDLAAVVHRLHSQRKP